MSFWMWTAGVIVATGVIYLALSINGKTEQAGAHQDQGHAHH